MSANTASHFLLNALTNAGVESVSEIRDVRELPCGDGGMRLRYVLNSGREIDIHVPLSVCVETLNWRQRLRRRVVGWLLKGLPS